MLRGKLERSGNPGPARIILADDQDLIRHGIRSVLGREADIEVVGEAANGREALEVCRREKPDLVIMDLEMPEMDGLEATRRIKENMPATSVIVLTSYEDPDYLGRAVRAGAAGYVLKKDAFKRVAGAIRTVLSGESSLDSNLAASLLRRPPRDDQPADGLTPGEMRRREEITEALTGRELEILRHIASGKNNQQLARELFLTVGTVKVHVHHVISKLGVSDRTQAALLAVKLKIFTPDL